MRVVVLTDAVTRSRSTRVTGLNLKGGVADLEASTELLLEPSNKVLAIRRVKVLRNDHMSTEGELFGVE